MDFWFDDGLLEDFTRTRPFLKEIGHRGFFAIVTNWVGTPGYMNIEQLKTLIAEGHTIVSHGTDHEVMKDMTLKETSKILKDSKAWICKNLGVDCGGFVAPFNILRPDQQKLALKIYHVVRPPLIIHFHSRNFTDVKRTITAYLAAGCPVRHEIQRKRYDRSLAYVTQRFGFKFYKDG